MLELRPLTLDQLPAAVELDQCCLGGLWTLQGYQRELESPNSELLAWVQQGVQRRETPLMEKQNPNSAPFERPIFEVGLEANGSKPVLNLAAEVTLTPHSQSIIGLGCLWAILEEAHITLLAIHSDYQGRGLGQGMLYALLQSAWQRGLERATLEVRASNHPALSLYQKFDFKLAGQRKAYYQNPTEDALILWRNGLQYPSFVETLKLWRKQVSDRWSSTSVNPRQD
ncbi:MAG: ribosomal protein S18-alanine N-acetyltransferase [Microcoleaceae cyanobacterium]